jgi:predicted regulator of Ras-like GTPase activity (Roadblock/LC7/MglB family)
MENLLKNLNKGVGIRGSMVITRDGVIVAASLDDSLEKEAIAGLASSVLQTLTKPGVSGDVGEVSRFTLSARHGRLIFEIVESLVLVVVTQKDIDLDITLLEIAGLAKRLQRMIRITV